MHKQDKKRQQPHTQQEREDLGVDEHFQIPEELWERMHILLPPPPPKKNKDRPGRPRMDDWKAMNAIFYVMRTGCHWKALPRSLGAGSTVHDRFQEWRDAEVFQNMWKEGLLEYDKMKGINWEWQAIDGAMTKAPLGEKSTGPNPTDRSKSGTKRSLLVEGNGVPLAVVAAGANRNDMKLAEPTLENMMMDRPRPTTRSPQNMCLDKGFDFPDIDTLVADWGYTAHIARKGIDQSKRERIPGYKARRWVVERTHSWMNRFRRLLIRWEKKEENYVAMLQFACAWITYQQAGIIG